MFLSKTISNFNKIMSMESPKGSTKDLLADHHALLDFESMSFFATEGSVAHFAARISEVEQEDKKQPRRSRRQKTKVAPEEKTFKCGCGKAYLSYAALYTHCKVKHTGIFPEGTDAGEKKKQGRPKASSVYSERSERKDHQA